MKPDIVEMDIRGQVCPSAMLSALRGVNRCRKALKSGRGQVVVLTDARSASVTIPRAVKCMGYKVVVEKQGADYRIVIG